MHHTVSIVPCSADQDNPTVIERTRQAVEAGGDWKATIRSARKIAVKVNAGVHRIVLTQGRQTELTEPAVIEGVLQCLRDVTDAEIVIGDCPTSGDADRLYAELGLPELCQRFPNVRLLDFGAGEMIEVAMRHKDPMFRRYSIHRDLAEADAFVSVAKMKAHGSMGCTLTIKNLFGWLPISVYGAPRSYLHDRLIRLPRVLCDLALWMKPCLNVVDGIVAANLSEWHGEPLTPGVILAGDNAVATDSAGARVMRFDPEGDYPNHPFFYRRNAIKLAAEAGLGSNRPEDTRIVGPSPEEVSIPFEVKRYSGNTDRLGQLQTGAATVAAYLCRQSELAKTHVGELLTFRKGELLWSSRDMPEYFRREKESGLDWKTLPEFTVRCLQPEEEIEDFRWYALEAAFACLAGVA